MIPIRPVEPTVHLLLGRLLPAKGGGNRYLHRLGSCRDDRPYDPPLALVALYGLLQDATGSS